MSEKEKKLIRKILLDTVPERKVYNYGQFKIIPVSHNLVDLFWGFGWRNQARFKWNNPVGRREEGEWELWRKTSHLPKDFLLTLEQYRKEK